MSFYLRRLSYEKVWPARDTSHKRLSTWPDRELVHWTLFVFRISWIIIKRVNTYHYIVHYKIIKVMYLFRFGQKGHANLIIRLAVYLYLYKTILNDQFLLRLKRIKRKKCLITIWKMYIFQTYNLYYLINGLYLYVVMFQELILLCSTEIDEIKTDWNNWLQNILLNTAKDPSKSVK